MLSNQQRCLKQIYFCRTLPQQLSVFLEGLKAPVPQRVQLGEFTRYTNLMLS